MKNKQQSLESEREMSNLVGWRVSQTLTVFPPQSGHFLVSRCPPTTRCSWLVPGLLQVSGCSTSPLVQRHSDGASGLVQGGKPADHFTPPSSSSCRLWVGRKVTKRRICSRHIISKSKGVSVLAGPVNLFGKRIRLCFFFFFLFLVCLLSLIQQQSLLGFHYIQQIH